MSLAPFVRTVLGDIEPGALGITYAHEHLVILASRTTEQSPDLLLDSVDDAVRELDRKSTRLNSSHRT